jgi:glycosyltransferase involved in cell wall biosynthesis
MTSSPTAAVERVLFVTSSARLGGGNRFIIATARELERRGIAVGVAFLSEGPARAAADEAGLKTLGWDLYPPEIARPLRSVAALLRSLPRIRRWAPDVVHANDVDAARAVSVASRLSGASLVCHLHRLEPLTYEELTWAFRGLPAPHAVIEVHRSGYDRNREAMQRALPNSAHHIVYNGIELARPRLARPRGSGRKRVGCVANLLPIKRIEDLLEMTAALLAKHAEMELWLIGDDSLDRDYAAELHSRREALGLAADRVRFLGRCDDIPSLLAQLDVAVHASENEACPLAVFEAMAGALPVVATAVGAVAETVEDGVHGFLVPPRRPDLLAERVGRLMRDPALAQRIGAAGRRLVEDVFDIRRTVDELLDIYGGSDSRRRRGRP